MYKGRRFSVPQGTGILPMIRRSFFLHVRYPKINVDGIRSIRIWLPNLSFASHLLFFFRSILLVSLCSPLPFIILVEYADSCSDSREILINRFGCTNGTYYLDWLQRRIKSYTVCWKFVTVQKSLELGLASVCTSIGIFYSRPFYRLDKPSILGYTS